VLTALAAGDRAGALEAALCAYFGPAIHPVEEMMAPALAGLFTRFEPGLIRQNILARPSGSRVFYIENQHCDAWALANDEPDPPVLRNGTITEQERLSGFAIQMVLFEASMGGLGYTEGGYMGRAVLARVSECFVEVPLGRWSWPVRDTRFLVAPGVVAHVEEASGEGSRDESWLFASASSKESFAPLRHIDGITWTGVNL
jgi:hypothetical protein